MPVSEPSKYTTLWSQSGIRFDIPAAADPVTGKAGFDVGFSSINMASEAAGGIPPWGQDFNGILYSLTKAAQYTQAGGIPTFDLSLSASVGGYGKGAVVIDDDRDTLWQCVVDGSTSSPNEGSSDWVNILLKSLPKRVFSGNDYIRIPDTPGGLIIQWGSNPSAGNATTVNFPTPFPNASLRVIATGWSVVRDAQAYVTVNSRTNSAFSFSSFFATPGQAPQSSATGQVECQWIAIGF